MHKLLIAFSISAVLATTASTAALAAASFQGLGYAPGSNMSIALAMSDDGKVVVGDSSFFPHAIRWEAGTWTDLGTLPGTSGVTEGLGVSGDGKVVVGYDGFGGCGNNRAFRWTVATGMIALGNAPGANFSIAHDANSDGSVIAGRSYVCGSGDRAARWTSATGWVDLGLLPGTYFSQGQTTNNDGTVVAGNSCDADNVACHGIRWTAASGLVDIGSLPGGTDVKVTGVSADGSVIVGRSNDNNGLFQAFRWTQTTMVSLGLLSGATESTAFGTNSDGSVVVGHSGNEAFRWTPSDGMQSVAGLLAAAGVTVPAGWQLRNGIGVSADGTVIAGQGIDPAGNIQGWIATIPLPSTTLYSFIGFDSPLENLPVTNSAKAGSKGLTE